MNSWVTMAAVLKMRMAMRMADVDGGTAQAKFQREAGYSGRDSRRRLRGDEGNS